MRMSPHATDHAARSTTTHHSIGRYGFQGSVSEVTPKPVTSSASSAATPKTRRRPPRRRAISKAATTAPLCTTKLATWREKAELPRSRYTGANA
jgi:hypothetical protein